MKGFKKYYNRYMILFLVIPLLYMFGGIKNILKFDTPTHTYSIDEIELEGFAADGNVLNCTHDSGNVVLKNIYTQIKNITIELDELPLPLIGAKVYFNNGGAYAEENSYDLRLRNGKNIINIPTYQEISEIKLVFDSRIDDVFILGDAIQVNAYPFGIFPFLLIIVSMIIVFDKKNAILGTMAQNMYILLSLVSTYLIYGLLLYYPTFKITILSFVILAIVQLFLRCLFSEVIDDVKENKIK